MYAEQLPVQERPHLELVPPAKGEVRVEVSPDPRPGEIGLGWRLLFVLIGFALASIGWTLVMTVILAFIGLPLFIFGLALMQAQER